MIENFVKQWDLNKHLIQEKLEKQHPENYQEIVKMVFEIINEDEEYHLPDPEKMTVIDHGDYQGTLLFIVPDSGYQPNKYWSVKVDYGSCSGCDTFEAIKDYSDEKPSEEQVKDYMTLALHILQEIKEI